jgi:hypothetical protein
LIDVLITSPILIPSLPLHLRTADISSMSPVGFYGCLDVTLADREGCELVTADTRLLASLQPRLPFLIDLESLPIARAREGPVPSRLSRPLRSA